MNAPMVEVYSAADNTRFCSDGSEETSIEGMTVSAIARSVLHCEFVRTSPSLGGGRGVSNGAMRFNWVLVMVDA